MVRLAGTRRKGVITQMKFEARFFNELSVMELYEILKARAEIFVTEQKIIYNDMDDIDYDSLHCFICEKNKVLAYLRAFYKDDANTVKIGRVLTLKHGKGLGRQLMEAALPEIRKRMDCKRLYLESQKHAIGFYERFGFETVSDEFLEEGIVHVAMELE